MKKLFFLSAVVLFSVSCTSDSDPEPISDSLIYAGDTYGIVDGLYVDFGTSKSNYLSHYNYDLFLTDGDAFTDESGRAFANHSYIFYVELFADGADGFDGGVFDYIKTESITEQGIEGKNWFSLVFMHKGFDYEPLAEGIESGTIDIEQTGDSFTIAIELKLGDGTSLSARYNGVLRRSIYLQKTD